MKQCVFNSVCKTLKSFSNYRSEYFFSFQDASCGFASHMKTAHDTYTCPTCSKVFKKYHNRSAKQQYERHLQSKCGKQPPPEKYACHGKSCDKRFNDKEKLYSHEGKCEFVIHQCDRCQETFKNRLYKSRHKCTVIVVPIPNNRQQLPTELTVQTSTE